MYIRVNISDLRVVNAKLIGDLESFEYGIYIVEYEFDAGDVVEQNEFGAWIIMDENKLFDIGNVY